MGIGAAIIGGSLISGLASTSASRRASKSQIGASAESIAEQKRQFDITRKDTAPYRKVGQEALFSLADMMGIKSENPYKAGTPEYNAFQNREKYDFQTTPGYQWRLGEGMKAMERSQSGRRLGGRAAKEALRYGQGYASDEYGRDFSRLSTIAGFGPQGVTTSAAASPNVSGAYSDIGNAGAGAAYTTGQGINNAIQGGLSNYMTWKAYNQPATIPTPTTTMV